MKDIMIKNIVFDLGGVIVDLDIKSSIMAFAQLGLKPKGLSLEELSKNGIPKDWEMLPLMHAMDLGEMDAKTFVGILKNECRPGTSDEEIVNAFNRIIRLPKHRLEWLQKLKQHYNLFLLSNIGQLHWDETLRHARNFGMSFEQCVHQTFLSYKLHMVKPDAQIFQHLVSQTSIVPQETLYIDDLPDNIEAGKAVGLMTQKIAPNALDQTLPKLFPDIR